jgi:Amt family ammonium transporter
VCYFAVGLKSRLGYDDSLDVVGVHMVGGVVGALLTGVFASLAINPAGADGGIAQLGRQATAIVVTLFFSFAATWLILKITDVLVGLRASEDDEEVGLDLSQHGEAAYAWTERAATPVGAADDGTYVIRDGDREIEIPEVVFLETARRVLELSRSGDGEVARTGSE